MKNIKLLKAEIIKIVGDIKNYWFNYIFGNINVLFLFMGLFYAFPRENPTQESILKLIIGMMIWYYGVHAIDLIAIIIEEEALEGTLEQIFMTRSSFVIVLMNRIIAQLIFDTIKGSIVFAGCLVIFKIPMEFMININWIGVIVIFFITLIGLYGLGYMVAGVSLIYKRASSVAGACSNLLLFFTGITIEIERLPVFFRMISKCLPLHWGISVIEDLVSGKSGFIEIIKSNNMIMLLVTVLLWIVVGIFIFTIFEKRAKKLGVLNQY